METPEFKWVARRLTRNGVQRHVDALLLNGTGPTGSFKVVENGTRGKNVSDSVALKHDRYDLYFDDFSCGLLQAMWEGWDPMPNCYHATLGSTWYPHCAEMTCWNYVNRSQHKQ